MFPLWKRTFPDAYFIFNDRDVEQWIVSRKNYKGGKGLKMYMLAMNVTEEIAIEQWRQRYHEHKKQVLSFFAGDSKFCHFRIGTDDPARLVTFLSPIIA